MELVEWLQAVLPVARAVARVLHFPVLLLLAQWHVETGGTLHAGADNNLAGITRGGPPNFVAYPDLMGFARGYVRTMRNGYYDDVLIAAELGAGFEELAQLLGESPWDAGGYGRNDGKTPGQLLIDRARDLELVTYADQADEWAQEAQQAVQSAHISDGSRPGHYATRQELFALLARSKGLVHSTTC